MTYKLKDLFELQMGKTPSRNNANYWGGYNKWISIADIGNATKYIENTKECITDTAVAESGIKVVPKGTVIMSFKLSIGKTAVTTEDMFTNEAIMAFIDKDICPIDTDYFYHFCCGKDWLAGTNKAVMGLTLNKATLSEINIFIPDIETQRKIAFKLNQIDELIAMRRKELDLLTQLVKSRFIEMFGSTGKQVPLIDYVWFQEGPGVRSADFTEKGTVLLTGSNINDNEISFGYKSDRHISNELASGKYAHFMCDKDDILVVSSAIDPDKFDKKVVVVGVDKKYCLNTGIIRFKPNKQYLTLGYFREFLKTDYFKHQVSNEMRGIAQMHFGPSHLKQMTILLPDSIDSQIEFDAFMQQVDKSKYYCVLALKIIKKLLAEVNL